MAIYTMNFTVNADGTTAPREPQAAGVSGDHHAAVLRFAVPFSEYRYRLEIADGSGGYDVTDLLDVTDGCVTYPIPAAWTAAGLAAVRLVGLETDENGTVTVRFHSAPAYLFFEERSEGEAIGGSLRPAWQETLDAAQFFVHGLKSRLEAGEFRGEKGDKGDTGNVSIVDELELVIDGGDAGGTVEITYADRVIEQGTDGDWFYRKWESGVAECRKVQAFHIDRLIEMGEAHVYFPIGNFALPSGLFAAVPLVTADVASGQGDSGLGIGQGIFFASRGLPTQTETGMIYANAARFIMSEELYDKEIVSHGTYSETRYVMKDGRAVPSVVSLDVKGRWKE